MIGLVLWIVSGLAIGAAAHLLLPGPRAPWGVSLGSGLCGGLLGGGAATLLDMGGVAETDPRAVVLSVLAALLATVLAQLWRTKGR